MVIVSEMIVDMPRAARYPFFTRSGLPAPKFCPTKDETATEKFMAGMEAKESILVAAV